MLKLDHKIASKLIAPPISGALRHVKENFSSKEEAVEFMVEYMLNPSKEKSVCMQSSLERLV